MPSEKILAKKQEEVKNMVEKYKNADTIVIVDYLGLTVAQDTELRTELRAKEVDYKVLKNRLLLIAFKELGIEGAEAMLQGPTAIAMSYSDHILPAKVCMNAAKKYRTFEIKGGVMDGKLISADDVKLLANMPSKEEIVTRVISGLNSPISGFINVLSANIRGLLTVLKEISENAK